MKEYIGMNFQRWCGLDADDERKIHYILRGVWDGQEQAVKFTSDDDVNPMMMHRIRSSIIERICLRNNEWVVSLRYGN